MQKKNPKTRCERRKLNKADGVCRFYSKIQSSYANKIDEDPHITEVFCNVLMDGLCIGEYTSDFLCKKDDGTFLVRECVDRRYLTKPKTVQLLDISQEYWRKHGVDNWGIVINKETCYGTEK